mmetsp:Transcript_5588/g.12174  ORF Transcript_5588/g.12174 Transcript_5588/m.12174 type:complete len:211 (+) Transcript_5588:38-670(+)|eukprot:CAMPEP_0196138436 /NCGR_PEP_ID=MMETSP0910-20130528/6077_1 /TAXON_ID=49265 /ORGANISM="Thalassiosira rotula, Strain GSO102" /LENGTH=210 /DNA_ID=CAMNT_0041399041 /DNA_START=24 /DNA_END=656 /DNA_ORIENTATION=+
MTFLPYPEIPYKIVHTGDIILLLTIGFLYELSMRIYQHKNERRTPQERQLGIHLATLRYEAAKKRAMGPSAFVETAKLERAVLATEKKVAKLVEGRGSRKTRVAAQIKKYNLVMNVLILLTYWGVAMVAIDGSRLYESTDGSHDEVVSDVERATSFWKGFLFPTPMGSKIAQFGIDSDVRSSCMGALTVFWAARVTCGELVDCVFEWASI